MGPSWPRGGLLDLLRFAASLLIVVYHFSAEGPWPLESLHPVFLRGYLATDFQQLFNNGSPITATVEPGAFIDGFVVPQSGRPDPSRRANPEARAGPRKSAKRFSARNPLQPFRIDHVS